MKKVLVVTYYWPPSGGPGVQRVLKFCKYLPEYGWEPIILTVKDGEYPAMDDTLLNESKDIETYLSHAFSFYSIFNWFTGKESVPLHQLSKSKDDTFFTKIARWVRYNLVVPDGRIGWYSGAVKKGRELLCSQNFDLIFSSGPPHSVHLIGRKLAKKSGTNWVADFRDPWTDGFYYLENPRNNLTTWIDGLLEKKVLRDCDGLITVSPGFESLLNSRLPIKFKSTVIYNGFDQDDFPKGRLERKNIDQIVISHTGSLSKSQNPFGLFESIKSHNESNKGLKIIIQLVGSIHPNIVETINKMNIQKYVFILPYQPHQKVILKLINSDFIFLVVPDQNKNEGIIPGKLFEYFYSKTEILLIGNKNSDAASLCLEMGYRNIFEIKEIIDFNNMRINLVLDSESTSKFDRKNLTASLAQVFDEINA
jgi:glycosyltransferase involved in cell wall biosynthesis